MRARREDAKSARKTGKQRQTDSPRRGSSIRRLVLGLRRLIVTLGKRMHDRARAACGLRRGVCMAASLRTFCGAVLLLGSFASVPALEAAPARPAPSLPPPSRSVVNVANEP